MVGIPIRKFKLDVFFWWEVLKKRSVSNNEMIDGAIRILRLNNKLCAGLFACPQTNILSSKEQFGRHNREEDQKKEEKWKTISTFQEYR